MTQVPRLPFSLPAWTAACLVAICLSGVGDAFADEVPEAAPELTYSRLADAKVAESLKLNDEQRAKVSALLTSRAEALSKADAAERPAVIAQNEKELSALLTEEQRTQFAKESTTVRLRFNFRFQKWADVLEWYARQANLSLILDAPPQGTFNYSDPKTYTPVEAMDLLNSVLSTKGYTLIRRGGMLLVIDVQDGIPDGLIPRIGVEELDKRGKFEMVSVLFPIGSRDAQAVKAEITPLQGPYGKSVLLPKTGQLLVTDSAGIVRAISDVIASIPKTSSAAPAAQPLFGVYPLKGADPKVAEDVLSKMFPGAKIAADAKAEQVNAYATPNEQAAIKAVIEQMLAQNPPDKKPLLEVYPIGDQEPNQLIANLQLVAPQSRIAYNSRERQLAIYATPLDHANLKASMEKLAITVPSTTTRQMEVYRLSKADPSSTLTLLQGLLPQVKFSMDSQTRRLVAIATPEDHKSIKAILDQLQSSEPGPDTLTLQFYPMEHQLPAASITTLMTLAPKAQIVANNDARQLQVLASPADQELIKANLETILKGVPAPELRRIVTYKVTPAQRTKFLTVLPTMMTDFPDIRAVSDGEPTELAIWAKPQQHELLKPLIESLATDLPEAERPQLISHPLRMADPTTALTVLKTLVPEAKVSLDSQNKNLVVIALTEQHAAITKALEKLQPGELGPDAPLLRFYPLEQALPATTLSSFTRLVPKATVTPDVDGKWLQVVATAADQRLVKNYLEDLQKEMPEIEKRKLVVHHVTPSQRNRFQTLLPSLVTDLPDVRIVSDGNSTELAIWAKPTQHVILKSILEELKRETPESERSRLVSYPLKYADPTTASTVLQNQFPGSRINVDLTTNRLLIWARPADHPDIKAAVEELDGEGLSERKDRVVVYPVADIDPDAAVLLLQQMLPKVRLTKDTKARTIMAWGKKADHELIAKALESMQTSADGEQKPRLKIYPATRFNANSMIDVLRYSFPNARISLDPKTGGLAALANSHEHEQIQSTISQMTAQGQRDAAFLVTYSLTKTAIQSATHIISQAAPEARLATGQDGSQLQVWARAEDHAAIEKIVEQMESDTVPTKSQSLKVYTFKNANAGVAVPLIRQAIPKATVTQSNDPTRLIVWAYPGDHLSIAQIVKQLDSEHQTDSKIEFYDIENVDPDSALRTAQAVLQKPGSTGVAALIQGAHQLYVEARPEQHEVIRQALSKLHSTADTGIEVFQLDLIDPLAADSMIRRMFSGTRTPPPVVEADNSSQKLFVKGTKEQISRVRELLGKMGETGLAASAGGHKGRVRVIPYSGDPTSALQELRKIWPQLRSNEIQIMPGGKSNLLTPANPTDEPREINPNLNSVPGKSSRHLKPVDPSDDESSKGAHASANPSVKLVSQVAEKNDQQPEANAAPPIIVVPKDGSITILSEDAEALEQFDKLIRGMSPPTEPGGRAFAVYSLKYAGATSIADTIRQALRLQGGGATRGGATAPTVVADERLNAVIVHANRVDRAAIEKLIDTLDSSEIPESLASHKPRRVAVKHGSAFTIESIVRLVYKSQLTTGGGRKEIPIPPGLPPEFATTLQQINAASSGPLLTLSVDDVSNSIVIMAPKSLGDQVTKLIEELDDAAVNENAQAMTLVPTQRMSSQRAQKILNQLLDKTRKPRRQ